MNPYPAYGTNYAAASHKRERAYNAADRPYNTMGASATYTQSPYAYYPAATNGYYNYMPAYDYAAAPYSSARYRRPSDPGPQPQGRPAYGEAKRAKAKVAREATANDDGEVRKTRRAPRPIGNVPVSNRDIPKYPSSTPSNSLSSLFNWYN